MLLFLCYKKGRMVLVLLFANHMIFPFSFFATPLPKGFERGVKGVRKGSKMGVTKIIAVKVH